MSESQSFYKISPIPSSGLGVVATKTFSRGDLIISEFPLFIIDGATVDGIGGTEATIDKDVAQLSSKNQQAISSLHNCFVGKLPPLLGIFKTNSLQLGADSVAAGLFLVCSRFNHSCIPNAMYSWNPTISQGCVYAIDEISPEAEITINYLSQNDRKSTREDRQRTLLMNFDFECLCALCANDLHEIRASDHRRRNIRSMEEIIESDLYIRSNPEKALGFCQRILNLWEEEGVNDITLYTTYYEALRICVIHGDYPRAKAFAKLALRVKEECEGPDDISERLDHIKGLVKDPQSHTLAGTSNKWSSKPKKGGGIQFGSEEFEEWLWYRAE
ncbi:uncharacterized protein LAJ45_07775 [Morchella importuna]|uniref:SET domain-containing protein n=1 Tax=Morchella conica CCBAS932 TaxID=1392247 RepID=A0A3N4KQ36_9PEZI|nr:uncharacterized protein LAJ45_07775 [Morchella importuna]KAH8148011.1 hypothetical protein LAJ45_07775 [Morchella importuna]RPB11549.1 SET domain-containing protein [Morchella conica CCBAS932]